ncbi:hypothetical protein AMECASPLE_033933 [Ameca splendens]|uniref:Uncharacterized protein n=1 Tax=Ameca splendens TaxID=208324 RepID=A0ABV0YI12_9TELE
MASRLLFGLGPTGSCEKQPGHQVLSDESQPRAWLQGGTPAPLYQSMTTHASFLFFVFFGVLMKASCGLDDSGKPLLNSTKLFTLPLSRGVVDLPWFGSISCISANVNWVKQIRVPGFWGFLVLFHVVIKPVMLQRQKKLCLCLSKIYLYK